MPSVRSCSAPRPARTARAPLTRKPAAAVVLGIALAAGMLAGCEYTYDDGGQWSAPTEATALPGPVFTRDPLRRDPVTEAGLEGWVSRTLPDTPQPVIHAGAGLLAAGEVRTEATPVLAAGTYALTLACRSQRRVTFTVRSDALTLIDLGLRCGINRENVVHLSTETALSIKMEARTGANYAYRLRRL